MQIDWLEGMIGPRYVGEIGRCRRVADEVRRLIKYYKRSITEQNIDPKLRDQAVDAVASYLMQEILHNDFASVLAFDIWCAFRERGGDWAPRPANATGNWCQYCEREFDEPIGIAEGLNGGRGVTPCCRNVQWIDRDGNAIGAIE